MHKPIRKRIRERGQQKTVGIMRPLKSFWKLETEGHWITDSADQSKMTCMSTGGGSMIIHAAEVPRNWGFRDQVLQKAGVQGEGQK